MGLDQYIFKEIEGSFDEDGNSEIEEIFYWRKNYELNEWAACNFVDDEIQDFNCTRIPLSLEMVNNLIQHIIYNLDKPCNDERGFEGIISNSVLMSFTNCKERIENGERLCYLAWW